MNNTQTQDVILNTLSDYGVAVLAILGAVLAVGLAYLVFKFGWSQVKSSLEMNRKIARGRKAKAEWKAAISAPDYKDPF